MAEYKRPRPNWHLHTHEPAYLLCGSFTSCADYEFYESFGVAYVLLRGATLKSGMIPVTVPWQIAAQIRAAVAAIPDAHTLQLEVRIKNRTPIWETWRLRPQGQPGTTTPIPIERT